MTDTEDFASLLAEQGKIKPKKLKMGERVQGKVVHVGKESLFVALSPTQEGVLPRADVMRDDGTLTVDLGDTVDAVVVGLEDGIQLSRRVGRDQINVEMLEAARDAQTPVDGTVSGVNKGGLEVNLGAARGFCPIGQVELGFVEDAQSYIGKSLQFIVRDVREGGRNVLLSRRSLLDREQKEKAAILIKTLAVGDRREGVVTRVVDFGAFVDIGGLEGLVPVHELTFSRNQKATDIVKSGEKVIVDVVKIEPDPKTPGRTRIGLSMKAAQPDPWTAHAADLREGATLVGKVEKLEAFGAFVSLFSGVDGLVHISELSTKRVRHPSDVLTVGQEVRVKVLGIKQGERRISLSLKAAALGDGDGTAGKLGVGATVTGKVERHEKFGVFLRLPSGEDALLPGAESGTPQGTDLVRAFPEGSEVTAQIVAVDERGRIKVSKRAHERAEEQAIMRDYGASSGGFGTFADLMSKKKGK